MRAIDRWIWVYRVLQSSPRRKRKLLAVLVIVLCGLIAVALLLSVPASNSLPLLFAFVPNHYVPLPWNESARSEVPGLSSSLNDYPDFRFLKLELTKRFSTVYGCPSDNPVDSRKSAGDSTIKPEPSAKPPYRLALLFLVGKEITHPEIWTEWFDEAKRWSHEMLVKKEGPFNSLTPEELRVARGESFNLFSVKTHVSEWKGILSAFLPVPDTNLPSELASNLVPPVSNKWGELLAVQYQLLKYALEDPHNFAFIFISDTTIPVKPFSHIYRDFYRNPRSRFFFPNVNLPLIRKHDQWVVLSRPHAVALVEHPKLWVCNTWFTQPYGYYLSQRFWAAPDEYLPFHALSTIVGSTTIWEQINNGTVDNGFPVLNWDATEPPLFYAGPFRHTWVCWSWDGGMNFKGCRDVGSYYNGSWKSPLTFNHVKASKFEREILNNPDIWFARKFGRNCIVKLSNTDLARDSSYISGRSVNLNDWIILKLQRWAEVEI